MVILIDVKRFLKINDVRKILKLFLIIYILICVLYKSSVMYL